MNLQSLIKNNSITSSNLNGKNITPNSTVRRPHHGRRYHHDNRAHRRIHTRNTRRTGSRREFTPRTIKRTTRGQHTRGLNSHMNNNRRTDLGVTRAGLRNMKMSRQSRRNRPRHISGNRRNHGPGTRKRSFKKKYNRKCEKKKLQMTWSAKSFGCAVVRSARVSENTGLKSILKGEQSPVAT